MYGDTTVRKRTDYFNSGGTDTVTISGVSYPSTFKYAVVGGQRTISTETLYPYLRKAKKQGGTKALDASQVDAGSNFYTSKAYASEAIPLDISYSVGIAKNRYVGTQCAFQSAITLTPLAVLSPSEILQLTAYGSTAIARCLPTNPVSGLSNFIGELRRDGLPSLPGAQMRDQVEKSRSLKGGANEYLNLKFAIEPTLSDLTKFTYAVKNHDKVLKQYIRDSGKPIRRKYRFPTQKTVTNSTISTNYRPSGPPSKYFPSGGTLTLETVETVDRWFSGTFCYYLAMDDSLTGKLQRYEQLANKLAGTRLSPELIWNLTPWSWAADWYANVGDVARNVSAFLQDGLVMRHGYVMEHRYITQTYSLTGYTGQPGVPTPSLIQVFSFERKARIKASPFGFGKTASDLSPRQLSIIAALGISQSGGLAK